MIMQSELHQWVAFATLAGISRSDKHRLLERYGSVEHVLQSEPVARHPSRIDWSNVDQIVAHCERRQYQLISLNDARYPCQLRAIDDAPLLLYGLGQVELLHSPQLACVGTRRPTASGIRAVHHLVAPMARSGWVITSGLALGIDGECHRTALSLAKPTIAVLGGGFDRLYPRRHLRLAQEIQRNGLLLSEYSPMQAPLPFHFPERNRIISGLSAGTLVIEAARQSGSLITAQLALEQGREVFAVPGSIFNCQAAGCHALLQSGAKLTQTAQDIVEELDKSSVLAISDVENRSQNPHYGELKKSEQLVLQAIGFEITQVDQILRQCGLSISQVMTELCQLRLHGYIKEMPGGYLRVK